LRVPRSLAAVALVVGGLSGAAAAPLFQTNLVSDIPGRAIHTDPNLSNPWGIAESGSSPFWIADNHTGLSTLYNSSGTPFPPGSPLVVTIPAGAPTGAVFTGSPSPFGAPFVFATEAGLIAAWSGGASAVIAADLSASGAEFKGLADAFDTLYATDFRNGRIDAFDSSFAPINLGATAFTDPNLPSGYSPFGIRNIGNQLYVTYAVLDPNTGDDVPNPGSGIVDVYDTSGVLQQRLIDANGALNSPWGLAIAPPGFPQFGGDLLVGNFGDGTINAFDPTTGTFLGTLSDSHGNPIVNDGLWALQFGNGGKGGGPNILYITAGLNDESNGLFAAIHAPEPGTLVLVAVAVLAIVLILKHRSR
jgi:uncharacterized protein (TIGR03118 family)